jgi:orotidine 5'-phosphate decarboxylase subfamily 2
VTAGYLDRLASRSAATGTVLCLGLDPDPMALPPGFSPNVAGIEAFSHLLVRAAGPHVAAVKANLAFFEAFGPDGIAALERIRAGVPAELPFIADAKRGDIGSTAARQAVALFDRLGADAITANPYLGVEAIAPLLEREDRFVYLLCRTSNPGAGELQDLVIRAAVDDREPEERLYERVARRANGWGPGGTVGLVVGATAPDEMARIRAVASGLAFLVPGVGAQGGEIDPVLRHGPADAAPAGSRPGRGLLVNVSRGVALAALGGPGPGGSRDIETRIAQAASEWATRLPVLL